MIPIVEENIKQKLAIAIPTGTPIILVKKIIPIPSLIAHKRVKVLSK